MSEPVVRRGKNVYINNARNRFSSYHHKSNNSKRLLTYGLLFLIIFNEIPWIIILNYIQRDYEKYQYNHKLTHLNTYLIQQLIINQHSTKTEISIITNFGSIHILSLYIIVGLIINYIL